MEVISLKKAVIVGGSNGIGLAITCRLIEEGYHACILDICEPDSKILEHNAQYSFYQCNLLDFDEALIRQFSNDEDVELLMITAGFGRVADFEYLHTAEIENLLNVNTVAAIKIVRLFYERICR